MKNYPVLMILFVFLTILATISLAAYGASTSESELNSSQKNSKAPKTLNIKQKTAPDIMMPDLAITHISARFRSENEPRTEIKINVKNIGTVNSPSTAIYVRDIYKTQFYSKAVPALAPGQQVKIKIVQTGMLRWVKLECQVDPHRNIRELNEENNRVVGVYNTTGL